ncbi:hypothetical protein WS87_08455 [Burkholderia sp. MSMB0856]|uniref:hypothetical protein n=1 Tax=Burkholderia sp. MSMB0856 TaxID=1637869 RepID=UPI0007596F3F|nr:hypothetical protein [Burkholderia sp. MSMB0856]AOJ86699.1 hypothetical protein WS87_08455 [Burkholderia sp. MSMB0856]KVH38040.1 hypothetical protein WS87_00065 [Burkholderia sp. MSMB0856]
MTIDLTIVCAAWMLAAVSVCRMNLRTAAGRRTSIIGPFCLCVAFVLALYAYVGASDEADAARTERVVQEIRGSA